MYEVSYVNESVTINPETTVEAKVINRLNMTDLEKTNNITVRKFIGNYNNLSSDIQSKLESMSHKEGFKVSVMLSGLKPNSTYLYDTSPEDNYTNSEFTHYTSDSQGKAVITEKVAMRWQFKLFALPVDATYNIVELPSQDYRSSVKVSTGSDHTNLTEQFTRHNINQNTSVSTGENVVGSTPVYVDFTNDFVPKQNLYISACKETKGFSNKRLDVDKEYQIHLEISNLEPDTILESDIGNLRADDTGNIYRDFAIKAGQFIKITNIPVNAKVVATELRNTDIARYTAGDLDSNYTEDVLSQRKLIRTDTDMAENGTDNYNKEPLKDLKTQELTIRQNVDAAISFINYSEVSTVDVDFHKVERDQNKFKDPVVTDFTSFELEDILNVKDLDGAEYDLYTESGEFIQHIEINSKTIDELEKQIEKLPKPMNPEEFRRLISLIQVESEKSTVKDLAAGNYYLIETKSPVGYKKNIGKINITITKDTASVVLTDEKIPAPYDIVPTGSSSALLMISLLSILLGLGLALRKKQQS